MRSFVSADAVALFVPASRSVIPLYADAAKHPFVVAVASN